MATTSVQKPGIDLAGPLLEIASRHGMSEMLEGADREVNQAPLTIALLGEFNAGKSTLANALLGKALLPTMEKPTTAAIVEIVGGTKLAARIEASGVWQEIALSELSHYVMGPGAEGVNKVELEVADVPFMSQGVRLVDTPGISSLHETHTDVTYGYLPMVDAAFLVLDINKGGASESVLRFLREVAVSEEIQSRIYVVLNLADTVSDDARERILAETRRQLSSVMANPQVFAVSAKLALAGEAEKSGIASIHEAIQALFGKREQIQAERREKWLRERAGHLEAVLKAKLQGLTIDTAELDRQLEAIRQEQERFSQESQAMMTEFEALREQCRTASGGVVDRYLQQVMDSAYDADTTKLEAVAQLLAQDLAGEVDTRLRRLNLATGLDPHGLAGELESKIAQVTADIRTTIDLLSPIITGVAIAAVTGPAGVMAAEAATASAGVLLAKTLAKDVLQRLDVPGMALKFGAKLATTHEVGARLKASIASRLELLLEEVELSIRRTIKENYEVPLAALERSLEEAMKTRQASVDGVIAAKSQLQKDILTLGGLKG